MIGSTHTGDFTLLCDKCGKKVVGFITFGAAVRYKRDWGGSRGTELETENELFDVCPECLKNKEPILRNYLGENLTTLVELHKWDDTKLKEIFGVESKQKLCILMNGGNLVDINLLIKVSDVFDVSLDSLLREKLIECDIKQNIV